jgi:hypothetical protein
MVSFVGKWVELDIIMLSEISQTQKAKNSMFFFKCRILILKKVIKNVKIKEELFEQGVNHKERSR